MIQFNWIAAVMVGGALGASLRFMVSMIVQRQGILSFPLATLIVNLLSCLLVGAFVRIEASFQTDLVWRFLVITGFCGGLSTFSAFSYETLILLRNAQYYWVVANILLNLLGCLFILYLLQNRI